MISFQIVETINPLIDDEVTWLFLLKATNICFDCVDERKKIVACFLLSCQDILSTYQIKKHTWRLIYKTPRVSKPINIDCPTLMFNSQCLTSAM